MSFCVCRDGFLLISDISFRGGNLKSTIVFTRMWVDSDLPGGLLMLSITKASWIRWSMLMSPGCDAFSERVLVLRMDQGRQTKDGASLA